MQVFVIGLVIATTLYYSKVQEEVAKNCSSVDGIIYVTKKAIKKERNMMLRLFFVSVILWVAKNASSVSQLFAGMFTAYGLREEATSTSSNVASSPFLDKLEALTNGSLSFLFDWSRLMAFMAIVWFAFAAWVWLSTAYKATKTKLTFKEFWKQVTASDEE